AEGRVVTWTDLASLDPGASVVLTVDARLVDVTRGAYLNRAQITEDSADEYSTDDDPVRDRDSTPGRWLGEDDEAEVEIPLDQILASGESREPAATPRGGPLPRT